MEEIIKYKANDGTEFGELMKCVDYENLIIEMKDILKELIPIPEDNSFQNGCGYIQQNKTSYLRVRNNILKIAQRYCDHKWLQQSIDRGLEAHSSWAGRMINECCPRPIDHAWYRIMATDTNTFREYGQIYYANNPEKAKDVCLNEEE